jgi:hypothetical protein
MNDVGIFYGHLVHFKVFSYILWTFGIVHGNLTYFSRFGIFYQEKSGNTASHYQKVLIKFVFALDQHRLAGFLQGLPDFSYNIPKRENIPKNPKIDQMATK